MIKILVVDDHAVVRQGLKYMLTQEFSDAVVGEAQDDLELLKSMRKEEWDVVILDISMPGKSGLDVLKDLKYDHPHLPVLVLSMHPEEQYAMRVLKAGAAGYITKKSVAEELITAVKKVLEGGQYVSPSLAEKLASNLKFERNEAPHDSLSDREYQVLCMIASGQTVSAIAQELSLSVKTISTHRAHILAKMQMKADVDLIRYAIQNRLVE